MSEEDVKGIVEHFAKPMAEASSVPPAAPTVEQLAAEHLAIEDEEANQRINPFDLINKGLVKIETYEEANAVASLLIEAEETAKRVKAASEAKVKRASGRSKRLSDIFSGALKLWTEAQVKGKKRRSIILDQAQVGLRKVPAHNETFCEADTIAWAESHLIEAIAYPPKLSADVVEEWEKKNGKPAPGRIKVDEHDSFKVKPIKANQEDES